MGARTRVWAGALALATVVAGTSAAAQDEIQGHVYQNRRHAIEISKPPGWYFITAGMIVELAKRSAGQATLRGEDDPVKLTGMAVIVSKTPSLGVEMTPHVVLRVLELKETPGDPGKVCDTVRAGMSDSEAVSAPRAVRLGARPAARIDFRGTVDGALVRATALCAVRERQAFAVVGQALAADFDADLAQFERILQSFKAR
jgi:hypothetical protein